jgi:hypothetical protein
LPEAFSERDELIASTLKDLDSVWEDFETGEGKVKI